MNSIEIEINSIGYSETVYIDVKNNKVLVNNIEKTISKSKIDELIRIIRNWKEEYLGNIIDSERFMIKINTNDGTDIIKGNGCYPENYSAFKEWIGSLYE